MKKLWVTLGCVVTFFAVTSASAGAAERDTVKVGLRFGSSALFSANLENAEGEGYEFGYFDEDRDFRELGWTEETAISMTAAGTVYVQRDGTYSPDDGEEVIGAWHIQLSDWYDDFDEAADAARREDGWPAYLSGEYAVRVGAYESRRKAEDALEDLGLDGEVVRSEDSGVLVTVTGTTEVLFEFDCAGEQSLGVMPSGRRGNTLTWFKGYKYRGGFEYVRPASDALLRVINVVDLEDYVKGVLPYEMNGDWPMAALEAQAVCARTFACRTTKHQKLYGFDVCNGTDCQVYNGANTATVRSDEAVENTAGECLYYEGELVEAVYHSSNGGATEDAENVWGGRVPYLKGKEDPYEAMISIPNYSWSVTYTADELTWILQRKGYDIGQIRDVFVSERTDTGNVAEVTFADAQGNQVRVSGDACRTVFYSSTYNKSVRSLRFSINGESGGTAPGGERIYVNGSAQTLEELNGACAISGGGNVSALTGGVAQAVTADGLEAVAAGGKRSVRSARSGDTFTITGTGNGHNVGMSQYGARAMAEDGYDYTEILEFYYTDITIR